MKTIRIQKSTKKSLHLLRLFVAVLCLFLFSAKAVVAPEPVSAYGQEVTDWNAVLNYTYLGSNRIAITGLKDTSVRILEIPEKIGDYTVTQIADYAFQDNKTLMSVVIPDTVTEIGYCAFLNCDYLLDLKVPSSVTTIEPYAFGWSGRVAALTVDTEKGSAAERFAKENGIVLRSEVMEFLETDTARYGMWDLTYMEFIEMYRSIGTENDLFLKMLKEKGARHTDDTIWFDYDGIPGIEIAFEDVLTEKLYALHYAPFEYNSADLESGDMGKDCMEAYLDHGGVCGILTDIYHHFILTVLEEYDWQYRGYGNAEVNHAALIIMTEDGRCIQIDNCGVDYWWLGMEVTPDYEKLGEYENDPEIEECFFQWQVEFEALERCYWHTFACDVQGESGEWLRRPVWYNYETSEWDMYLGKETPKYYKCVFRGIEEVISMAGNTKLEGYIDITELGFDMSVFGTRPRNVKAENGDGQVTLTWNAVEGATMYGVSVYENGRYTVLSADITGTQYTAAGLTNGKGYEFLVQAYVDGVWSEINASDHVKGWPMGAVPTEDDNFYYKQIAKKAVMITGIKNTEATELEVPKYVGDYAVKRFTGAAMYGSTALETLYVPVGIMLEVTGEDWEHMAQITVTVVTADKELLELCEDWSISCKSDGDNPLFDVQIGAQDLRFKWKELLGAAGYRVTVWNDGECVYEKEHDGDMRSDHIWGVMPGTTYQVMVQAYVDGAWSTYTEEDLLTLTTYVEDDRFCYGFNDDGTLILVRSLSSSLAGNLVIPNEYEGKKITRLDNSALYWCNNLEKVYIPNCIIDIHYHAFNQGVVIYGSRNSAAASYAAEKGLQFVEFDGKPEHVAVVRGEQSLSISWDAVEFATEYLVTLRDAEGKEVERKQVTTTTYESVGLENGKNYAITVQSVLGTLVSEVEETDVIIACPVSMEGLQNFVTRMYRIILEREPDAGSATWVNGLKDGSMTGVRVADGFVLSEEMLNKDISNEEFVKILYRAFFGREADEGGLATWKGLLDNGCKKTYVFAGFANSAEFGALCAEAGIVQGRAAEYLADRQTGLSEADYKVWCFVERMYMEVLNRTADEPGVRSWVAVLLDGSYTGTQVAEGFIMSEEFLAKNMTNEEYVRIMYRAFFGRDADAEGLATWTNALATGWTKQEVFAGFANSNEFGVLCEQAGIVKGTAEGK